MAEHIERDPFYVGYLPLPKVIKQFIVPWLIGNLVLAVGIAVVIASNHREPGDGSWELEQSVTIDGFISMDPYPLLHTEHKTYILVQQGKLGVQEWFTGPLSFSPYASVTGFVIERDGRTVLELYEPEAMKMIKTPGQDVIDLADRSKEVDLGTHTLVGEIVDPKCYLGVMQPGDGKTHKTCATLCIKGGIPPMLLVRDKAGNTAAYLVTDAQGNAFPESHHEYIADPIEVTGQVMRDGDLLVLRADLDSIRRLGPGG